MDTQDPAHPGLWELDLDDRSSYRSPRHDRIFGYESPLPEWTYQTFLDHVVPEDRAMVDAKSQAAAAAQEDWSFECRIRRVDGEIRWVWVAGAYRLANASHAGMVGLVQDITERKEAEEELRRSHGLLASIAESTPDAMFVKDCEGRYELVNAATEAFVGKLASDILGKDDYSLFPPDEAAAVMEGDRRVMRAKAPMTYEETVTDASGTLRTFMSTKGPLFDEDGRLKGMFGIARDITEHKQMEEDYSTLFREMLNGFAVHDIICDEAGKPINYRYRALNPAFERMTGLKAEDTLGRTVLEVLPGVEQYWIDAFGRVALTGESATIENYVASLGKHFQVTAFQPAPMQFACLVADITERKRTEQMLEDEIFRRRVLVDQSSDGIVVLGRQGDVLEANQQFAHMLGYSLDEVYGLHIWDWDALHDREQLLTIIDLVGESGEHFETQHRRKDGSLITVEISTNAPIIGGEKQILCICRDITERKELEEALRQSENRYRNLVDFSPDAVVVNSGGRYVFANQAAARLFGVESPQELIGADALARIHPDYRGLISERIQIALAGVPSHPRDLKVLRLDGTAADVEGIGAPIEFEGQPAVQIVFRDIAERKQAELALRQAEEQLRQSQKMEAVGQLAGGIAHDFNNLLTAILGYSDMILACGSSTVDEVRPDLEEIKQAGVRASSLTQQILAYSRRQALRPRTVGLDTTIRGIEPLLRRTLGEDIDLIILDGPGPAFIDVDPHQFEQVVMNLALNARDAMPSGGRLTMETANVELDEEFCDAHPGATLGPHAMLRVTDTGAGMDEGTLEHIFEPFFTTKPPGAGTGLGLATVYGIVKQSNGSIFATSAPGKGASFEVFLPRALAADIPGAEIAPSSPASPRGHETVLVVEDEPALRGLVGRALNAAGYRTLIFGSAQEALAALEKGEGPIDLLLADVLLPGTLQGPGLAEAVKATLPDLPVLYMSGYTRDALVHAGRLDKGVNLLEKPFTPAVLVGAVREALDQPRTSGGEA